MQYSATIQTEIIQKKLEEADQGIIYEVKSIPTQETLMEHFPNLSAGDTVKGSIIYTVPDDTPEGHYVGIDQDGKLTKAILYTFFLGNNAIEKVDEMVNRNESDENISKYIVQNSQLSNAYPVRE